MALLTERRPSCKQKIDARTRVLVPGQLNYKWHVRTYNRDAPRDGTHLHNNHTDQDKADATVAEIRGVLYTACAQQWWPGSGAEPGLE